MYNYIVKVRDTRIDEYRIILTPKLTEKNEARDFVEKQAGFDKYDESGMWVPDKGLGMAKVLDYITVKWWNDGDEAKRDEYRAKYKEKEEIEQSRKKSSQTD